MVGLTNVDFDVVIVGAGLTGSVAAGLLRRAGFSVCVVEARTTTPLTNEVPLDPRALAVTPGSRRILAAVHAWPLLPAERIGCFRRMQVWDAAGQGEIEFSLSDLEAGNDASALGYIIESTVLQQALASALAADTELRWQRPAQVTAIKPGRDHTEITLDNGRLLRTGVLVVADGKASPTRQLAKIDYLESAYPQHAIAAVVTTEQPHEQVARQRFLASGPLAFLPLADAHQCGIVWSTRPAHAAALLAMPDDVFAAEISSAFDRRLGDVTGVGPRGSFALAHAEASDYCQPRLALIGDAAHCVHPLAGQGANLGWYDAASLAEVLTAARAAAEDIGSLRVLRRYARWRRGENQLMQQVLDGLHHLFLRDDPVTRAARNLGLTLTHYSGPLKQRLLRHAMGLDGQVPAIVRGQVMP
ncbi:MAG: UbiH/UbiF/VisC/COQ6 family ubiquinone biosynthesis hydroxylase [Gammaproteobacteria bacterium]